LAAGNLVWKSDELARIAEEGQTDLASTLWQLAAMEHS
jgi:hypothetical protein